MPRKPTRPLDHVVVTINKEYTYVYGPYTRAQAYSRAEKWLAEKGWGKTKVLPRRIITVDE